MSNSQDTIKDNNSHAAIGLFIGIGLVILGLFIYWGFQSFANRDRIVTVKGLAEQEIKATSSVLKLSTSFSGNTVKDVVLRTKNEIEAVKNYLTKNGYNNFTVEDISIFDSKTTSEEDWSTGKLVLRKKDRFYVSQIITIPTQEVEQAEQKRNKIELDLVVDNNVTCDVACDYVFPTLNDIKPALIAESTKNARIAGEQFAKDSKSQLGKIKTASQGQISISGGYDSEGYVPSSVEPYIQNVRVVSSIVFFLED